jgi:hypothetical protein
MSSRTRSNFSAGNAGSSKYKVNTQLNSAGGSKKQGIASRVGLDHWANSAIQTEANGTVYGRNLIFHINQLGGVGAGHSMFHVAGKYNEPRGVRRIPPYSFKLSSVY